MSEEKLTRAAVVTGGSRGIGRAVCLALAKQGCNVVVNYCHGEAAAAETAALCKEQGVEAVTVQADVSTAEGCKKLFEEAVNAFGRVDILVNNAGITRDNLILRLSEEDCDEVRREVEDYHKYNELIRTGDLYRHVYPMEDLNRAAWSFVAEDKSEVLLTVVTKSSPLCNVFLIRLCGLDPDAYYREERSGRVFSGALLMKAGYNMSFERNNDGSAVMTHFVRV